MSDYITIISNFGFPIALACYLLFRFEKKLDSLQDTNDKLCQRMEELEKIIESCKGRKR